MTLTPLRNNGKKEEADEELDGNIIGVGGTGSYVLDYVAKTPVSEIHLFDKDDFLVHNAFRAPGAPSREQLNDLNPKVNYLHEIYSRMHKFIIPHSEHISNSNLSKLAVATFVFICIDKGEIKKSIVKFLEEHNIPFIDVGIGLEIISEEQSLIGQVRSTTSTPHMRNHIHEKSLISFTDGEEDDVYSKNIQIAELNAMNAAIAVIRWKKQYGFYQDLIKEHHTVYSINDNSLNHGFEA